MHDLHVDLSGVDVEQHEGPNGPSHSSWGLSASVVSPEWDARLMPASTDSSMWWVSVDGWQLESGELEHMTVGAEASFPPAFAWHRPPDRATAPAQRQQVRRNTYRVTGELSSRPDGVNVLDLGIPVPQNFSQAHWFEEDGVHFDGFVTGTISVHTDFTWWPGESSDFLRQWKIAKILGFVPKSGSARQGSWTDTDRTYREGLNSPSFKMLCQVLR